MACSTPRTLPAPTDKRPIRRTVKTLSPPPHTLWRGVPQPPNPADDCYPHSPGVAPLHDAEIRAKVALPASVMTKFGVNR